ncbi:DUF5689 domain-containing protein [Pedobacter endophyticus]|uniref:DUF5689 domain-containing protein n=1 Tax=Pedobacter endophyticus TaxID=2789740 RepID=A0A7S9L003_9SPHI|nr:DUF5689 domain-containing protein [Pedobacter endophyticus]QPH39976.1 hypothetical protein IZT61_01415 [Pedobacter endophyticus]
MKKTIFLISALVVIGSTWIGCKRDTDYIGITVSPYISNFDLRKLYKNADVALTSENLGGADYVKGIVISDQSNGNIPAGLMFLQNSRIAGNGVDSLRGIAINIGTEAAKYVPGDSVHVKITGSTMKRVNGILQLDGVAPTNVDKKASGRSIILRAVNTGALTSRPMFYESTLITISKGKITPEPVNGDTYAGNKTISDGFGTAVVHTETAAKFATDEPVPFADFTGIVITTATGVELRPRSADDIFALPEIKPSALIITGYMTNPNGSDVNYEYIQFKATRDIDFAVTPYSVVTCNNAGILAPPNTGWAFGDIRTYKFNIKSGTVKKGQFCYVGANKRIWGSASTDISNAVWIVSKQYSTVNGDDFGTATGNLLANSGNVAGVAVFEGLTVTGTSTPLDVIMYGGNGAVYAAGPPEVGYRITNTDKYSTIQNRKVVAFYGGGTNKSKFSLPTPDGTFTLLGGVYDATTGIWSTGRNAKFIALSNSSPLSAIEQAEGFTTIEN